MYRGPLRRSATQSTSVHEVTKLIFCVTVLFLFFFFLFFFLFLDRNRFVREAARRARGPLKGPLVAGQLEASVAGTEQHGSIYSLIYISLEIFLPSLTRPPSPPAPDHTTRLFTTCRDSMLATLARINVATLIHCRNCLDLLVTFSGGSFPVLVVNGNESFDETPDSKKRSITISFARCSIR